MHRRMIGFAVLVLTAALALPMANVAQGAGGTQVGTLACDISGGIGMIIASKKDVTCTFVPADGGRRDVYIGSISKFGLDLGATSGGRMVWAVFAPSVAPYGALAGDYVGATAEATVGAGLGANALIGGSNHTITLQPLSVQGQTGLNVAAGVAGLSLRPAR